ncbi:hypothetical protein Vi05172_g12381 [Venturia inaequalis]|nr:hypothetical protein Vi05172_g12381 [Venturia inaequalis]
MSDDHKQCGMLQRAEEHKHKGEIKEVQTLCALYKTQFEEKMIEAYGLREVLKDRDERIRVLDVYIAGVLGNGTGG